MAEFGTENRRPTDDQKVAEQIFSTFSDDDRQEPVRSYSSESDSVITLANYSPGTIFRIEHLEVENSGESSLQYSWYVVGERRFNERRRQEGVLVHRVFPLGENTHQAKLPKSTKGIAFEHGPISLEAFPIKDAKYVLEDIGFTKEEYQKKFPVARLDVMGLGVDLEKTQPVKVLN